MLKIGLLGGIASGKSTVARLLAEQGAMVLDADRAAHEALADPIVRHELRQRFGEELVDDAGNVVRSQLAELVFGPSDEHDKNREFLESLVHPRVRQLLRVELDRLASEGCRVVVLDIPLLIESGWADECDLILFVESKLEDRQARIAERGWSPEQLRWRERAQLSIPEKRARATDIFTNVQSHGESSEAAEIAQAVDSFWQERVAPRLSAGLQAPRPD